MIVAASPDGSVRLEAAATDLGHPIEVPVGPGTLGRVMNVLGEPVEEWVSPLKAATYHGATVERQDSGWRAVVLFDV